ncbi:DUF4190 domain-containing protein [Mycobacterium sp. DL592]|uniref:DUF4190 domain-containing protein n=1 Tax=Mycobacterium sp. DL592 TaxID=2675524 RepID=UPI00141F3A54|nr:DUF4190 domain-containing protein [Mycobacterium sp. DL592]
MTNPTFSGDTPDPYAPVDYPANYPPLPPPVYPPPYPPPGAYPYPPYAGDPYDPYRPLKPPGTNGKAIAALVCSLAGLALCGLPSVAGVILGIVAMRETKRTGQDGFGLAVAGVAIGSAIVALVLLYIVFMVFVIASSSTYTNY